MSSKEKYHTEPSQQSIKKPPGLITFIVFALVAVWFINKGFYPSFYYLTDLIFLFLLWCGTLFYLMLLLSIQSFIQYKQRWLLLISIPFFTTLLISNKLPLRIGFLTAYSGMIQMVEKGKNRPELLTKDVRFGLYEFSAKATNIRHQSGVDSGNQMVFILSEDIESAFIYSPEGIDNLVYNSGSKGALFNDWYWMKQD